MKSQKCPHCGFISSGSADCKRCRKSLNFSQNTDPKTLTSIKTKQSIILDIGGILSLILSFSMVFIIEDAVTMAVLFIGIIAGGFFISWIISSLVEQKILAGSKLNYKIKSSEKAAVFALSLFVAYIVFINGGIGYILAPFLIIFVNGSLYLYEYQMKRE